MKIKWSSTLPNRDLAVALLLGTALGASLWHSGREELAREKSSISRINPYSAAEHSRRASACLRQGDRNAALAEYNHAIEQLNSQIEAVYYNRGRLLSEAGHLKDAIRDYDRAISLNPTNFSAHFNRALLRKQSGDIHGALADYQEALKIDPKNAGAYYNRALARREAGDRSGCIEDLSEVLKLDPRNSLAYYNRSLEKSLAGDKLGSAEDMAHALKIGPNKQFLKSYDY